MRREALLLLPLALAAAGLWLLLPHGGEPGPGASPEVAGPSEDARGAAPAPPATAPTAPAPPRAPAATPSIAGRVRDEAGAPVAGASVVAIGAASEGGAARVRRTTTDEQGRFALEDVGGGRWSLSVDAPEFVATTLGDLGPGRTDLEVTLAPRGWIEATVLGPDGAPWTGAVEVRARFVGFAAGGAPASAVPGGAERTLVASSADGVARVRGLPAGLWRVTAAAPADAAVEYVGANEANVTDGRPSAVEVRLGPAARLEGTIAGPDGRPPAAPTTLELRRSEGASAAPGLDRATVRVGDDGRWSAGGLAEGTWTVLGRAGDGAWVRDRVAVPAGGTVRRDLVAQASGTVRVRAVGRDGTAVPGLRVVLSSEDGAWKEPPEGEEPRAAAGFATNAEGVHVRTGVPPGRVRVETRPDERHGPGGGVVAEVPPGGLVEVEVVVPGAPRPGR